MTGKVQFIAFKLQSGAYEALHVAKHNDLDKTRAIFRMYLATSCDFLTWGRYEKNPMLIDGSI